MPPYAAMNALKQSPTDPAFVQNPYPFYADALARGPLHLWQEYDMPVAFSYTLVKRLFRDRRFGRECPPEIARPVPAHLAPFYALEQHSMLELEPPRHTRLRSLVLRAFTSGRIQTLQPQIETLTHQLIDDFPTGDFDLIPTFANTLPVIIISRLLGVPDAMSAQLLKWSDAMVAMYQARRSRTVEDAATNAASDFTAFMRDYIDQRRAAPADDLITHLITAEEDGEKLSTDEMITTCILLLNAGHGATVHSLGNGIKTLLDHATPPEALRPERIETSVDEIMRFDPPLHMFTRYAYEDIEIEGHRLKRGDKIGLLIGSANRDANAYPDPNRFDPARRGPTNTSFGGGVHFCVGAPLARLELQTALPILFQRCPGLRLTSPPTYADTYHFHGLDRLMVTTGR